MTNVSQTQRAFHRALFRSVSWRKYLLSLGVLLMCGLISLFMQCIALQTGPFWGQGLRFTGFFICISLLMPLGVLLAQVHREKEEPVEWRLLLKRSADLLIGTVYYSIPPLFLYLALWMLLGFFKLFFTLPAIGKFLGAVLAFVPFLINLLTLLLVLMLVAALFFVVPVIAQGQYSQLEVLYASGRLIQRDPYGAIKSFCLALAPLGFFLVLLLTAVSMAEGVVTHYGSNELYYLIHGFFVMLPFMAVLTPALTLFFSFAVECHELSRKCSEEEQTSEY